MKERMKRFYEEHKAECIVVATSLAAVVLVSVKASRDNQITGVEDFMRADGASAVVIFKKNGDMKTFTKVAGTL